MTARVRKAVVPVAGRGTRFLPATKVVPKELLPVVDRPAVQYVVEEAVAAGLDEVCLVTSPGKSMVAAHFASDSDLEAVLATKGDERALAEVRRASAPAVTTVTQDEPRGLGHAVACAEAFAAGEPVAVLLGDDFVDTATPVLADMCALHEATGASVVLLIEVPDELVSSYGIVEAEPLSAASLGDRGELAERLEVCRVVALREKPPLAEATSRLAAVGRYVLSPAIFEVLRDQAPGRGGEIQLTDALDTLARDASGPGGGVVGLVFRGARYDTGDRLEYLKAVVALAAQRSDLGPDFVDWLRGFVAAPTMPR